MGTGAHYTELKEFQNFSSETLWVMNDEQVEEFVAKLIWPENDGKPICPKCGNLKCNPSRPESERHFFRCSDRYNCDKQFSLTSQTLFKSRKLPLKKYLIILHHFLVNLNGTAALSLPRGLNISYKSAFVMLHKFREAFSEGMFDELATGNIQIDGKQIGGHNRPANFKANNPDHRKIRNQSGKKQNLTVISEDDGRTRVVMTRSEAESVPYVDAAASHTAIFIADEGRAWDPLGVFRHMKRINHSEAYSADGVHTNGAEGFFSRIQRMVSTHRHISGDYAFCYSAEAATMEDFARYRVPMKDRYFRSLVKCLKHPPIRRWAMYYRSNEERKAKGFVRMQPAQILTLVKLEARYKVVYGAEAWKRARKVVLQAEKREPWRGSSRNSSDV